MCTLCFAFLSLNSIFLLIKKDCKVIFFSLRNEQNGKLVLHLYFFCSDITSVSHLCHLFSFLLKFHFQPGFHLEHVGPYSFSSQKLGQISVKIYSKDHSEEPIPSVLLSLSGDNGYRNNSVSGAGGVFLFNDLFPGTFYLRPLLKVLEEFI